MQQGSSAQRHADEHDYLTLTATLPGGGTMQLHAAPGFRVMELIRMGGVAMKAECGGSGVCATCHIRVSGDWRDKLPPPSDDELAKLDEIAGADDDSRLACQIEMTDALDGLQFAVSAECLDGAEPR